MLISYLLRIGDRSLLLFVKLVALRDHFLCHHGRLLEPVVVAPGRLAVPVQVPSVTGFPVLRDGTIGHNQIEFLQVVSGAMSTELVSKIVIVNVGRAAVLDAGLVLLLDQLECA